jgi:hypothetical protein
MKMNEQQLVDRILILATQSELSLAARVNSVLEAAKTLQQIITNGEKELLVFNPNGGYWEEGAS